MVLGIAHVKNVLDTNAVSAFFVETRLVCDDHTWGQRRGVWRSPSKCIVRILMDWATVTYSVANAMGEITADLPKMFSCIGVKSVA